MRIVEMDLNECAELLKKHKVEESKSEDVEHTKCFLASELAKGVSPKIPNTFDKDTLNTVNTNN
jgi:hypothetical protein